MQAPIDDDDVAPVRDSGEETSFAVWAVAGGVLVLVYVLIFIVLRSA